MRINLINVNRFIKNLNPKNDIYISYLFEQCYFSEIKENIKIYNKIIEKIKDKLYIDDMTKEEEKKYRACFNFLISEIKNTKKTIKKIILIK